MLEPNAANIRGLVQLIGYLSSTINSEHDMSARQPQANTCMVRRDDEVRSKAKPGSEVPLWDPASFTRGFVSRLLPNDIMSSPIMTAIVRARLTVGAFADAGTCIQNRYLFFKRHFAPRDEGIFGDDRDDRMLGLCLQDA